MLIVVSFSNGNVAVILLLTHSCCFLFLGMMIVDDGSPITGRSEGRFLGLDLVEPFYLGGVPSFNEVHSETGFTTGFLGCISRLVIGTSVTVDLMRDAKRKVNTNLYFSDVPLCDIHVYREGIF